VPGAIGWLQSIPIPPLAMFSVSALSVMGEYSVASSGGSKERVVSRDNDILGELLLSLVF